MNAQRESTALRDNGEKLEEELKNKEAQLKLQNEKILAIQEKLELTEQKLAQYSKLPDVEEELRRRMAALTQVRAALGPAVHRLRDKRSKSKKSKDEKSTGKKSRDKKSNAKSKTRKVKMSKSRRCKT